MTPQGISEPLWQMIISTIFKYAEVQQIIVYGSRARGDAGPTSDIDIAIDAPTMTPTRFAALWNEVDDLPIVIPIDLLHLQQVLDQPIAKQIKHDGVRYSKDLI